MGSHVAILERATAQTVSDMEEEDEPHAFLSTAPAQSLQQTVLKQGEPLPGKTICL